MNKGSVTMGRNNDSAFMQLLTEKSKKPEDVAAALGVAPRTVFFWLSGERTPRLTISQVQALCKLLECSVFELPVSFSRPQD